MATVRLAHEALISRWKRAKDQLTADRRDLETRAIIERQHARWAAAEHNKHQLLLRDPDLANALDLEKRWGDELPAAVRDFIAKSQAAARAAAHRRRAIAAAVMVLLAVLAAASFGALYVAEQQRSDALIAEFGVPCARRESGGRRRSRHSGHHPGPCGTAAKNRRAQPPLHQGSGIRARRRLRQPPRARAVPRTRRYGLGRRLLARRQPRSDRIGRQDRADMGCRYRPADFGAARSLRGSDVGRLLGRR